MTLAFFLQRSSQNLFWILVFFSTQKNDPTWSCATHVGGKINLENHLICLYSETFNFGGSSI